MAITTRNTVFTNVAAGKGFTNNFLGIAPSSTTTAGAAASGFHTVQLFFNNIGTTLLNTLVGFQLPPLPGKPDIGAIRTIRIRRYTRIVFGSTVPDRHPEPCIDWQPVHA